MAIHKTLCSSQFGDREGEYYLCNLAVKASPHKMTLDWNKVTCKNCLKQNPQTKKDKFKQEQRRVLKGKVMCGYIGITDDIKEFFPLASENKGFEYDEVYWAVQQLLEDIKKKKNHFGKPYFCSTEINILKKIIYEVFPDVIQFCPTCNTHHLKFYKPKKEKGYWFCQKCATKVFRGGLLGE